MGLYNGDKCLPQGVGRTSHEKPPCRVAVTLHVRTDRDVLVLNLTSMFCILRRNEPNVDTGCQTVTNVKVLQCHLLEQKTSTTFEGQTYTHTAVLSDSLEFLDRQSSLQIKQSRQSNERLIQDYRNNNNCNVAQKQWSHGKASQHSDVNRDRDSGIGTQPKRVLQALSTAAVERPNDPENSVISAFQGQRVDGEHGMFSRPTSLRSHWTNDWVVQTSDINTEHVPTGPLQPTRIELLSQPLTEERQQSYSSDPNTSLSSGFSVSEDTPTTRALSEQTNWRRHGDGNRQQNRVYRDGQSEVFTDQQPKDHSESAGPVMSGASSAFGGMGSYAEHDRGQSLSINTDPKRSLRRQWTADWVGLRMPADRSEDDVFLSSASLPPIRIQGQFRPVSRQRSDASVGQRSLPSTRGQGQFSRQRSDPGVGKRSLPPTRTQEQLRPVSRQRSDPGARRRSSSEGSYDAPMTVASWLQDHAWSSRHSHRQALWRYPSYHQGYSGSADPLLSLHKASRAQQTRSHDESGRGQGYTSGDNGLDLEAEGRIRVCGAERRLGSAEVAVGVGVDGVTAQNVPPTQPPVKVYTEENHGGNTRTEQKEESENSEPRTFFGSINALFLRMRLALAESVFAAFFTSTSDDKNKDDGGDDSKAEKKSSRRAYGSTVVHLWGPGELGQKVSVFQQNN
ncbi:hypothetical protein Bbelb_102520 [Branchiostoma belcheri]|nr:hypothetical protein Bbelb_102520 [Branchiostoma belcheri]